MASNNQSLLHSTYLLGIALKGLDGLFEVAGGAILLFTSLVSIIHAAASLAHSGLPAAPGNFVANHALHIAQNLAPGTQHFASAYLLVHGLIKVGLVAGLLRGWRRAYPIALLLLSAFIGYQVFRWFRFRSPLLAVFTIIDIAIVLLIWFEWRRVRRAAGDTK